MIKDRLLKSYSGINKDINNPLIKIFVSYIKPSFLYKSDVLTPIHLGRAIAKESSKDGVVSDEDLKWLYENCIGDDDFEGNISSVNRKVGFLTGTWWAYKNYEKLGSPEYFGSFGYRRLLMPTFLDDLKKYDAILPDSSFPEKSLKEQFILHHGIGWYNIMIDVIAKTYPDEINNFNNYFELDKGYFCELYILKKELFFDFCEWIFPLLFEFLKIDEARYKVSEKDKRAVLEYFKITNFRYCDEEHFDEFAKRAIGFIMERITGYYLYKLKTDPKLKIKETKIFIADEYEQVHNQNQIQQRNAAIFNSLRKNIKNKTKTSEVI